MTPDIINGLFEIIGALLTWMSIKRVIADKGYAGIYAPAVIFFMSWGIWNLFYYPHLGQWWSFAGGCAILVSNASYGILGLYYKRKYDTN